MSIRILVKGILKNCIVCKVTIKSYYRNMNRQEIITHITDTYGITLDCPFSDTPDALVFRHSGNRKWFGLIMSVSKDKLGFDRDEPVDIINLKAEPMLISTLVNKPGFCPAYHMNKTHWITVLLDGSAPNEEIMNLIEISFIMTFS